MTPVEEFIAGVVFGYTQQLDLPELVQTARQYKRISAIVETALVQRRDELRAELDAIKAV